MYISTIATNKNEQRYIPRKLEHNIFGNHPICNELIDYVNQEVEKGNISNSQRRRICRLVNNWYKNRYNIPRRKMWGYTSRSLFDIKYYVDHSLFRIERDFHTNNILKIKLKNVIKQVFEKELKEEWKLYNYSNWLSPRMKFEYELEII
jgi:hypothetical protein